MTERIAFCIRADGEWIPILDYIHRLQQEIKSTRADRDVALEELNKKNDT